MTDKQKIDELFTRGVGEFIDPDGIFRKKLETNPEKIVIKFGVDPTRPDIHLGHAVILHKLRQFQNLGCKVIFLVGDFTALIGDPTGKSKIRPEIEHLEIQKNMKTYLDQVDRILLKDEKVFSWTMNSDWFVSINDIIAPNNTKIILKINKGETQFPPLPGNHILSKAFHWEKTRMQKGGIHNYTLITLLSILRKITFSRLIERDMFQERIKNNNPVFMHEMLYPVIQGIDSDAIANIFGSCDLEVGGTDQHFNMLVGRDVMEMNKKIPQSVLSFKLLEGTDGKEKMSKSLDNYVGITDEPNDMYGKIMSIPDSSIVNYFELCTFTSMEEVEDIRKKLGKDSTNPKDIKMNLAKQIVEIYHGKNKAKEAEESFIKTFQKGGIPDDVLIVPSPAPEILIVDYIIEAGLSKSKSDARRKIEQGGVELDGQKIMDPKKILSSEEDDGKILKVGKKDFIKISF